MTDDRRAVLIVDDDPDIRDSLKDVLADEGFRVDAAQDGLAALEYLRSHSLPDIILLDWMMPRCDGATFRSEQLKDSALAHIPVVLFTADSSARAKMEAIGAAAFLQKPVDLKTLMSVLDRCCAHAAPVTAPK